jgi:phosphatidylserine/phosphatidylglycerophosphate/cardiolipin synthase-like enzyme
LDWRVNGKVQISYCLRMKKEVLTTIILATLLGSTSIVHASRHHSSSVETLIDEALVKTPKDQEVCFSPDEYCDIKLLKFVQSAQKSIDVAIFDINLDQLVHALLVQAQKIPVRIIVDKREAKGPHSLVSLLIKAGANVRHGRQRGIFHNKFMIVDGKMIETGSFNYTHHASRSNNENQIYLANPQIVERFKKHFDEIWKRAEPTANK